jgi:hypothetical protein
LKKRVKSNAYDYGTTPFIGRFHANPPLNFEPATQHGSAGFLYPIILNKQPGFDYAA